MLGIHSLPVFIVSGVLLNLVPGPDSVLVMSRSASQGWRAGSAASFGVGSGVLVHVLAAALGLSALLATSATAFTVVKLIGAAYLVYMGASMLLSRRSHAEKTAPVPARVSLRAVYAQGLLTNVTNPKVALFFLAFVPQFISPTAPSKPLAFIVLGAIFCTTGLLWCHVLAFSTAFASDRLRVNGRLASWGNRAIGAVFVALGVKLALSSQH